jgi:four helix bundle protein
MHNPPSSTLHASSVLEHALAVAALVRPLVDGIQRKDRDLASQVRRAVNSIALNTAEAQGSASGNARLRFESALGSLYEARAGIQLALVWGYCTQSAAREALASMHHLGARLYGIARR